MAAPSATAAAGSVAAINRALFDRTVRVVAVRARPQQLSGAMRVLKGKLYKRRKTKAIVADPADPAGSKLILLDSAAYKQPSDVSTLPAAAQAYIREHKLTTCMHDVRLTYENFGYDDVLAELVSADVPHTHSFETVGSLAHLNLRTRLLPYKHIIGQALYDKNENIHTVVNKVGTIASTFRTFDMEVLAGSGNTLVEVNESQCRFQFDFRRVYWNTRLGSEHQRMFSQFSGARDVVADMMCGVGPFAVPLAKRGVAVYANDLNPESFKYLVHNKRLNKLPADALHCYNMDGRDFMRHLWQLDGYADTTPRDAIATREREVLAAFAAVPHAVTAKAVRPAGSGKKNKGKPKGKAKVDVADDGVASAAAAAAAAAVPSVDSLHYLARTPPTRKGPLAVTQVLMNLPASAVEFLDVFREFPYDRLAERPTIHCYSFASGDTAAADLHATAERHLGCPIAEYAVVHVRDVSPLKHMFCLSFRLPDAATMRTALAAAANASTTAAPAATTTTTTTTTATTISNDMGDQRQQHHIVAAAGNGVKKQRTS